MLTRRTIGPVLLNVCIILIFLHSVALAQSFYQPSREPDYLQGKYCPDEIIIKFKRDCARDFVLTAGTHGDVETSFPSINAINKKWGVAKITPLHPGADRRSRRNPPPKALKLKEQLGAVYKITLKRQANLEAAIAAYAQDEHIAYAEPNYLAFTSATFPTDPSFPQQWSLDNTGQTGGTPDADLDAPEAWDITTGSPDTVIAVLDTGIDWNHPDLAGTIWTNAGEIPGDTIDNDGNGYIDDVRGWDFVSVEPSSVYQGEDAAPPDNDPMDAQGHGTHCAGIIGATGNNAVGIAGVTWQCSLMAVRAGYKDTSGGGSLQHSDIAAAIIYATDNGADIINMSFGGGSSNTIEEAINYAYAAGVTLVASAGNSHCNCIQYPASYDKVLAVSSFDHNDRKAASSNFGDWIDVAAPGVGIYSTYVDDAYATLSGTSMAAPQVCGVAGLIRSLHPEFTHEEIRQVLRISADDVSAPGWDEEAGYGRVNAFNALHIDSVCRARISAPMLHEEVGGILDIRGTASGENFFSYNLYYGEGTNPERWNSIGATSFSQVTDDLISSWDTTALPKGYYTLKLVVRDNTSLEYVDRRAVLVSNVRVDIAPSLNMNVLRFGDTINFTGTITATDLQQYEIEYGEGAAPSLWFSAGISLANNGQQAVVDGAIGSWNTAILPQPGEYSLRITVSYSASFQEVQHFMLYLDPSIKQGWPKTFYNVSPVSVGYLDGEPTAEVMANIKESPGSAAETAAWKHNGEDITGWPVPYAADSAATIATGDVDADGMIEAVLGYSWESDQVYLLNHDGTLQENWPRTGEIGSPYEGTPVLSDIDGDGDLEIFAGGGKIFAWHHDGTPVAGWPREIQGSSPAIGNINNDGSLEIVVISMNELYVFDPSGNTLPGWPVILEDLTYHPPLIGDIDNNGSPEIIAPVTNAKKLYVFKADGTVMTGWPQGYYGYPPNYGAALGDINGDGYLEIFLASASKINAWDYRGAFLPGWPVYLPDVYWIRGSAAPVLADVTGDGTIEMLMGVEIFEEAYEKLFAYTAQGAFAEGWPKRLRFINGYGIMSSPALSDLDNDGDLEVVVSSNAEREMKTDIYVWDLPYDYNPATIEWGMLANDTWHTGAYGDHIPPITYAQPPGNVFSAASFVRLQSNEPATIYYTTDGSTPTDESAIYTAALFIQTRTTLKFFAIDTAGNKASVKTEVYTTDFDGDGILSEADNCPVTPNGPGRGTCTSGTADKIGRPCLDNAECGNDGFCSMSQEDTYPAGGDGIGDACYFCEGDFDFDNDVDGTDAAALKADFGRTAFTNPCVNGNTCKGDFACDHDVDGSDAALFKGDFGRSAFSKPCPARAEGEWCLYQ